MKTLSLCMIVRDEEKNLTNCLENASVYADEIVVVDTGSTDNTKTIASKYTDKIFDFLWIDDFSKARNFSFDKASCNYIMWLDADDIVPSESVEKILEWKNSQEDCDVLMCRYVASVDEDQKPIFEYYRERIVKNNPSLRWKEPVHEAITPQGKIIYNKDIYVRHNKQKDKYTDRNLNIYLRQINEGVKLSPRAQFYFARELYFNNRIDDAIHELSKFISSGKGWKENNIEACLNLARCYLIKEDYDKALSALFGSFVYAPPRGEILYEIGTIFKKQNKLDIAIYWYNLALNSIPSAETGAFVNEDCYGFLPAIELCACYYNLGDFEKSLEYHRLSSIYKPNDKLVKYNQAFFDKINKN